MKRLRLFAVPALLGIGALLCATSGVYAQHGHGGGGHGGGHHGGGHMGGGHMGGGHYGGGHYGGGHYGGGHYGGGYGYGGLGYGGLGYGGLGYGGLYGLGGLGYGLGGYGYGLNNYGYGGLYRGGSYGYGYGGGYPYSSYYPSTNYSSNMYSAPYAYPPPNVMPAQPANGTANIEVRLPVPDAQVTLNGAATSSTGMQRFYSTPPLEQGFKYSYDVVATWVQNGQNVRVERNVQVVPDGTTLVDFATTNTQPRMQDAAK